MRLPETSQRMLPSEKGKLAHVLIRELDSRLQGTPEYLDTKTPVGSATRDYVEKDAGSFAQGTTSYEVFSKKDVAWEIPFPLMSGIPMPRRVPIVRRQITITDERYPENPKITFVKLRTRYKIDDPYSAKEEITGFRGGTIFIRDGRGTHKNSPEAIRRVTEVIENIDPRLFSH